jgi:hypothetical protein
MKRMHFTALAATFLALSAIPAMAETSTIPSFPVGSLSAYPTVVQTGTKPTLTWSILYPSTVPDLVTINPPGTIESSSNSTYADVKVVGAETLCNTGCTTLVSLTPQNEATQMIAAACQQLFRSRQTTSARPFDKYFARLKSLRANFQNPKTNSLFDFNLNEDTSDSLSPFHNVDRGGNGQATTPVTTMPPALPVEARISFNGGAYQQLFYGTQSDIDPAHTAYFKKLVKGDTLDFGGRYLLNGAWTPFYTTRSSNLQVVALVNGQMPPTHYLLYRQAFVASYLKPYLDASGRVRIGPLSVLILRELDNSDHSSGCFDYQDMILLVTLAAKNNNGNGNNIDGVDCSNPGNGHGGPNGTVDPSGGVDDEIIKK